MGRNRLIAGIGIVVISFVCIALIAAGIGVFRFVTRQTEENSQRSRIVELGYCSSSNLKPCVVSFSRDAENGMLVNILTPASSYADFYLIISGGGEENRYECQKVRDFPRNVYCTGRQMYPGLPLRFTLFALEDSQILGRGNFSIIGLLLETPGVEVTETPPGAESAAATEAPTAFPLEILTPDSEAPIESYPNPSYPNSYP